MFLFRAMFFSSGRADEILAGDRTLTYTSNSRALTPLRNGRERGGAGRAHAAGRMARARGRGSQHTSRHAAGSVEGPGPHTFLST